MAPSDLPSGPTLTSRVDQVDFELLFNSVPGLYLVLDPELRIVGVSDAYLRATMQERASILGKSLFEVFPDEPGDEQATGELNLRDSLRRVLREGVADAMAVQRYPIPRPEELGGGFEMRHWSPSNYPVLDADGHVAFVIHRVQDVTEFVQLRERGRDQEQLDEELHRRHERMEMEIFARAQDLQAANRRLRETNDELDELRGQLERKAGLREEELRSSDERFRLLVNGVRDYAIYLLDRAGNVTSWAPGAEQIFGYREDDILGEHFSCTYLQEDRDAGVATTELAEAARAGSVEQRRWRVGRDGSRFWGVGVLTALYDAGSRVRGYVEVMRDLTQQHRSEALLKSIVDTVVDGIITIDGNGRIESFNHAAESIFGYEAHEVIGSNVKILMPQPYHGEHDAYLEKYARSAEAGIIGNGREVRGRRKDGTSFPLDLAVSRFEQEGRTCFTGLVRDLTARRKMERQLQEAQKMEAMGQLAAGVAHDFNNLLTVISGYSDLLLHTLEPEDPVHPQVSEIHDAARRASSLTRQLLAASRQQVLEPRVLDVNEIVADSSRMLRRLIGEDIKFDTVLGAGLPSVLADPGQIGQVLLNLAVNARDAMPSGGRLIIETAAIEVEGRLAASPRHLNTGRYVRIAVSDTGHGMDAETATRVFEPFFTTKGVGKGTGLGLSVVHGIVKQSGGAIDVYSEPGTGTVFKIYLPAVDGRKEKEGSGRTTAPATGNETILLVEDDRAVRDLGARILRRSGYTVVEAIHGPDALRIAEQPGESIDLVLTDVVMPEMGGRRLVELLRERRPSIKVVFMSGYPDDAVVRQGILQADIEFLEKPFTPVTLARKIREVLDKA